MELMLTIPLFDSAVKKILFIVIDRNISIILSSLKQSMNSQVKMTAMSFLLAYTKNERYYNILYKAE